jgi:Superfamily I DNA and RNA helicases and helicase subunits
VLSTLTNGYFSPLMAGQRFDVLIVEEASMAVLPALFYAACLGRRKTVIVGDPCQLPSIVQSNEEYVRKVMGRNIFEVTVAEPLSSPLVAMLDVQYRMHPLIGELVSDLFYAGRLKHGAIPRCASALRPASPMADHRWSCWIPTAARRASQAPGDNLGSMSSRPICVSTCQTGGACGAESVAIITPYVDQARAIRARLKERTGDHGDGRRIECSTVHRFQGQERDVSSWTPLTQSR